MLAPDIAFIPAHRLLAPDARECKLFSRLSPGPEVEIASPNQHRPEMAVKAKLWLGAGVSLRKVVWPTVRQVDVWHSDPANATRTLRGSDVLDGETVPSGFEYPISRLWR